MKRAQIITCNFKSHIYFVFYNFLGKLKSIVEGNITNLCPLIVEDSIPKKKREEFSRKTSTNHTFA